VLRRRGAHACMCMCDSSVTECMCSSRVECQRLRHSQARSRSRRGKSVHICDRLGTHPVVRVEHRPWVPMREVPHLVPKIEEAGSLGRSACQVRGCSDLSTARMHAAGDRMRCVASGGGLGCTAHGGATYMEQDEVCICMSG